MLEKLDAELRPTPPILPLRLWGLLALTAVYVAAGKLGLTLAFVHVSATAVWPPTGIALAAMLLCGYRVWPVILLGAFMVNVTTAGSVWTSLGIAAGNTLEALVGAFLVTQLANGRRAFDRARDVLKFTAIALLSTTVSATVGVTSLTLGGYASWYRFGPIWLTWWLGDVAGALVVAPVLLLWGMDPRVRLTWRSALELTAVLGAVVFVGWAVFGDLLAPWVRNDPLEFLCLPPLVLAAFRFGQREAATSIALLSVFAVWGTVHGGGPFIHGTQNESLLLLQVFMVTMVLMTLPLAAVVRAHARAEDALSRNAAIVASSDDAILSKTLDGVITTWNEGAERLYGYSAREAVGQPVSLVIPPDRAAELPMILAALARGERAEHFETVRLTKDGRRLDVSVTVSPIRDSDGRVVGASSVARDITHRNEIETANRERDALRSVASLAAAAAHEINNPLAVVLGQAQLLADEIADPRGRRRLDEILEAVVRIEEIVTRMKRITRIELLAGSLDLPETLDIRKSSEPGAAARRLLLIVSRATPARVAELQREFGEAADVILDRRQRDRRHRQESVAAERRVGDRRRRDVTGDLRTSGWALVPRREAS